MGLVLSIIPTDETLIGIIKRLNESYPHKGSSCMLIAKQIKERDYIGAATTFALSFAQLGDDDDLPKVLAALAEKQYDSDQVLMSLYDILGDLTEEGDDFQLNETSDSFGSYRSVHYFRSFAAHTLDLWCRAGRLSLEDGLQLLKTSQDAPLVYDSIMCPHLTEHSDCDGYYFPIYTKYPINPVFGSLYGLAEELVLLYRTGIFGILSSLKERRLGFDAYLLDYIGFILTRYVMLVRFVVTALEFDDTIVFC
jgi:hypothetical protein